MRAMNARQSVTVIVTAVLGHGTLGYKVLRMIGNGSFWGPCGAAQDRAGHWLLAAAAVWALLGAGMARAQQPKWSAQEEPIVARMNKLRSLPDDVRVEGTRELALEIRRLPAGLNKVRLANGLASLSTEGDFGHETLQEVATTLAAALAEHPVPPERGEPAFPYRELATLVRYEHVEARLNSPDFAAAQSKLAAEDRRRAQADFTLRDLQGKEWNLRSLRGKVVLVNFWATWCPPCRKEIPDLESLYQRFKGQGLIVLGVSHDDVSKIESFVAGHGMTYPVLVDANRQVSDLFAVEGIPQTYVFNRDGKLVAEALDMRTQKQFLRMLAQAGLE
jgi:peroxiredoxin